MLFRLALRNVAKTLSKRLVFGFFFSVTVALLFVGNTVFENSDRGLSTTYVNSFTAQVSLSAPSEEQFTIFGSDLPLVGEFLVLPVLPESENLRKNLAERFPQARLLPQVSAAGSLALDGYRRSVPVFGVDFQAYFRFFPALKLIEGSLPEATEPSLLITDIQAQEISRQRGRPLAMGERFTLTFAVRNSFVIREVRLAGVYSYPSSDVVLDRIVLTDPDTARALNGYLYGASESAHMEAPTRRAMEGDLNDLFSGAEDTVIHGDTGPGVSAQVQALASEAPAPVRQGTVEGAWNFLLINDPGRDEASLVQDLRRAVGTGLQVRDWRETAGGTALVAWFLRWVFNLGLLFIAVVSCMILINSLALTILERTREIGTMRALGASRAFIGELIAWETLIVVVGSGILGVLIGILACTALTASHISLDNVYLASLLGGRVLALEVSWSQVAAHLMASLLLGLIAVILPIRRALAIDPVKAIARDQ